MGRNVPKLRFKEFNDEWIEYKLGEKTCIYDGTHQTPKYTDHGVKFVSVENIEDIYGTDKFISEEDYENGFKIKPQLGDIFMTRITAGVIGATAIVDKEEELAFYVSLALIRVIDKNLNSLFLKKYIESIYFKKELNKRIIHVAFPKKINLGDIGECSVNLPSLQEQERIANFLTKVDKIIEKQDEKVKNLENYKKGMMQKIFSQEIRFKDENGEEYPEWEERKLGKIIKNKKKGGNALYCDYKANILLSNEYLEKKVANITYVSNPIDVYESHILILWDGSQSGKVYTGVRGVLGSTFVSIELDNFNNNIFVYQYLNYKKTLIQEVWREGSGVPHVAKDFINNFKMFLPCLEEQIKISMLLNKIDLLQEKETNKLENLKQWKKGLLQQMFV